VSKILAAWESEPGAVDESTYTSWAHPGFHAFNGWAAEREFCELAGALARMVHGPIIETGTGGGFTTRRIAKAIETTNSLLICYESDQHIREALSTLDFFDGSGPAVLADDPTPTGIQFAEASLTVLDSDIPFREREIDLWAESARYGSLLLVHDTGNSHPVGSVWMELRHRIQDLVIKGAFLNNPRGAFLGVR